MRKTLVISRIKNINYSSFILEVKMLIFFLCNTLFKKKLEIGSRQSAWEQKINFNSHQRLNVEHPNHNDHSKSVNKSKFYEDKENFHK
jgi:hypothetical protein